MLFFSYFYINIEYTQMCNKISSDLSIHCTTHYYIDLPSINNS